MNTWSARRPIAVWISLVLALAAWAGSVWAVLRLVAQLQGAPHDWQLRPSAFGFLLVALLGLTLGGVLLYRALSALTLHYRVDRNAVTIHWLGNRAVVPMNRIERVDIGLASTRLPVLGSFLGYVRGTATQSSGEPLHMFATGRVDQVVVLHTASSAYAIAPIQRDAFVQEVEERRGLGIVQGSSEGLIRTTRVSYPFWTDGLVRVCLLLGLVLNLVLWGILAFRYSALANVVSIRFDATGAAVDVAPREQVLAFPLIGLLVWLANTGIGVSIYRWSRVGALLLLIGASVIQVLLVVALGHSVLTH